MYIAEKIATCGIFDNKWHEIINRKLLFMEFYKHDEGSNV